MKHPPTIETSRLILRPFTTADAPRVMALAGDKRVYASTLNIPHPYEEGMAEKWISTHDAQFYNGNGATLAITLTADRSLIGAVALHTSKAHNRAELGYWLGADYWGAGYCTEAVIALMKYGFAELALHKITSRHFQSNPASGRVMVKAGMLYEGTLVDEYVKDGVYHTSVVYGLLSSEPSPGPYGSPAAGSPSGQA